MAIKRKPGQVVKIDLYNGYHTYGYEINHGNVAILDIMTQSELSVSEIFELPRLFDVGVLDIGFKKWKVMGNLKLDEAQRRRPDIFLQDILDLSIRILDDNGEAHSASFEEIQTLERASGWYGFNVEQRVRDHFAGKTNVTVEFLRPKPPDAPHFLGKTPYTPEPGTIKQIALGDGTYVYARELENTFFAIYDSRTEDLLPPKNVTTLPVLFTVSVSLSARIGWKNVGYVPLIKGEYPLPNRYFRIGSKPTDIMIHDDPYDPEFKGRKGTLEEAKGLEPAIMWDNYQVENRLRAYYGGHPWAFWVV